LSHSYRTNAHIIGPQVAAQIRSFDFTTTREGKTLGLLIAENMTQGIVDRLAETGGAPSTGEWPRNSIERRDRKRKAYGWDDTNYATGQMLSFVSVLGVVTVEPTLVTMAYRTGQPPQEPKNPNRYMSYADAHTTDEDKSFWAHTQGRGFYELDDQICAENYQIFATALGNYIREPQH
jgi:hypothetical protein